MEREDRKVYEAIQAAIESGQRCALATVIATRGSTPRKNGAKMLVDPSSGLVGTVGGGCGEAEVIEVAAQVMETGIPRTIRIDLTDDPLSWSGSICGGILDVFVEPICPR